MAKYSKMILFVAFLFCLLELGTAKRCYSCTTLKNKKCEDPFDLPLNYSVECNDASYGCMKQISKSTRIVHRGCAPMSYCAAGISDSDHCDVCEGYLCNSSSVLGPSLAFSLFVLIKTWISF